MPGTIFHLGPALILALIFPVNLVVTLISSVIVDIEPLIFYILAFLGIGQWSDTYSLTEGHGYLHSFLGAIPLAFLISFIAKKLWRTEKFEKLLLSAFIGLYSHLLLDAIGHEDMLPLFPISGNPLFIPELKYYLTVFSVLFYSIGLLIVNLNLTDKIKKKDTPLFNLLGILIFLFFLWVIFNPYKLFGFSCFGLTTYSGVPVLYLDLKIDGNGIMSIREKSHFVSLEEVRGISDNSEFVILGIGYNGMVEVDKKALSMDIPVMVLRTDMAIKEFNRLRIENKRVTAIIHSTC